MSYAESRVWKTTLAYQPSDTSAEEEARQRLRVAFESARRKAALLAAEIPRDLPNFTVHDITHLDALWEMVGLAAGEEYPITPVEAFVLGCAFLAHDLGMTRSAYQGGRLKFRAGPLWEDCYAAEHLRRFGRRPSREELSSPDERAAKEATIRALRLGHAEQAIRVLTEPWGEGNLKEYLVDDVDLRRTFGEVAGTVAASHWWSLDRVRSKLCKRVGAPAWTPDRWSLDVLKVACLLRVSDAMHIDARRAPTFLKLLRRVGENSESHWSFQERIHKPYVRRGMLVFSSARAFAPEEASAWWGLREALLLIDREIRGVSHLLAEAARPELAVHGVEGAQDTEQLRRLVETAGWIPIASDFSIRQVATVVERLGGAQLYGQDLLVPFRELIQNSCDAVRAKRFWDEESAQVGNVSVRIGGRAGERWVEVSDTGIGMTERALSQALLDFGTSYWDSDAMYQEYPGLAAKGFEPDGVFGIGFFSVFMLGPKVHLRTRPVAGGRADTRVLELDGVGGHPVVRCSTQEEELRDPGTAVRVWLNPEVETSQLLGKNLGSILRDLCVGIDATLTLEVEGSPPEIICRANEWKSVGPREFVERFLKLPDGWSPVLPKFWSTWKEHQECLARMVGSIGDDGCLGRAALWGTVGVKQPRTAELPLGWVTAAGMRAHRVIRLAGILAGRPVVASRSLAVPVARRIEVERWASDQARRLVKLEAPDAFKLDRTPDIASLGGDLGRLPIAWADGRYLGLDSLRQWASTKSEILLIGILDTDLLAVLEKPNVGPCPGNLLLVPAHRFVWPSKVHPSGALEILISRRRTTVHVDSSLSDDVCEVVYGSYGRWSHSISPSPKSGVFPPLVQRVMQLVADEWGALPGDLPWVLDSEHNIPEFPEAARNNSRLLWSLHARR